MTDDLLQIFFNEMGSHKLLTEDEERALSARALKGDVRAQNRLAEANLRLVVWVANQYKSSGLPMSELISEGNIGLVTATAKYDATRGGRFAGFAAGYVRRQIEKAIAENDSENANINANAVVSDKHSHNESGDINESTDTAADFGGSESDYPLDVLNEREERVVRAYFGIGQESLTMAEIAAAMGLRRERVRQIRDRAVRRMRSFRRAGSRGSTC